MMRQNLESRNPSAITENVLRTSDVDNVLSTDWVVLGQNAHYISVAEDNKHCVEQVVSAEPQSLNEESISAVTWLQERHASLSRLRDDELQAEHEVAVIRDRWLHHRRLADDALLAIGNLIHPEDKEKVAEARARFVRSQETFKIQAAKLKKAETERSRLLYNMAKEEQHFIKALDAVVTRLSTDPGLQKIQIQVPRSGSPTTERAEKEHQLLTDYHDQVGKLELLRERMNESLLEHQDAIKQLTDSESASKDTSISPSLRLLRDEIIEAERRLEITEKRCTLEGLEIQQTSSGSGVIQVPPPDSLWAETAWQYWLKKSELS